MDVSKLCQMGVALGAAPYGTAATSFTRGLLVSELTINPGKQDVKPVPEVRGDFSVRRVTMGPIDYDASFSFPLDVGDIATAGVGDFLVSVYGTDTGSAIGLGIFKHVITLSTAQEPPYLNLWTDKDATDKQLTGFRPSSVKFTIDAKEGMITCAVEGIGKDESNLTATQTLVFSNEPLVLPSQATVFTVGGATVTNFDTVEITLSQDLERFRPIQSGRTITALYKKNFKIEISMTGLNFANETERAKFKATGSSSFALTLTDSGSNYITFDFPEIYYTTFEGPGVANEDLMTISMGAIVTGDPANHNIEIQNTYDKNYGTGIAI